METVGVVAPPAAGVATASVGANPVGVSPAGAPGAVEPGGASMLRVLLRTRPTVAAVTFAGYTVLASLAVLTLDSLEVSAAFWAPTGFALGVLLLTPRALWPSALVAVAASELVVGLVSDYPLATAAAFAAANVVEPAVAATMIRRLSAHPTHLVPLRELMVFLAAGAVVGPLVGGSLAAWAATLAQAPFAGSWPNHVLNHSLGVLVVAPLMLSRAVRPVRQHPLEALALTCLLVGTTALVFSGDQQGWTASLPYLIVPVLAWAALRFGSRGAALVIAVFAPAAAVLTALGQGPFDLSSSGTGDSVALRMFLVVLSVSSLMLAALVEDLMARDTSEAILRHAATHDALTGLPNRLALEAEVEQLLADRRRPVAVLMCDLDNFKLVNDNFGHHAGDALLVDVAGRLRDALRGQDLLARIGGDEFVVAAPVDGPSTVAALTGRVRSAVDGATPVGSGATITPSTSVGVVVSGSADDATSLLRKADAAMYRAKEEGRSRVRLFDDELRAEIEDRLLIETEVAVALREGQLVCAFQPEVYVATGELFSFEALARWHHPTRGVIMPDRFVAAIERSGRAGMLFERTLGYALDQQRLWHATTGLRIPVSVNLSPGQLSDPATVDVLDHALDGIDPQGSLWIEVTENALMGPHAGECLSRLSDLGVSTAIDDFGTGWASMARLSEFHWDALKVDRRFVARLDDPDAEGSTAIVAAMIALAHSLGTIVVAEGVETPEQLDRLTELGCDVVQGFLVSRPRSAATALDGLEEGMRWRVVGRAASGLGTR